MPLVSRTFDQLIDFTRTSAATYVDSTGKIVTTPASRNLLTYTQEFNNATWVKDGTSATANSTNAPDGTATADTITASASTAQHHIYQTAGPISVPLVFSIYAKANTLGFIQLRHASSANIYANFNLNAGVIGTVGSSATASISAAGNGWYRCSIFYTPASSASNSVNLITSATAANSESWTATGTESVYLWGAQLEQASAATDYTRNNGGVYPPRFDYDPVTLAPKGLLIEEQRTNLLTYSEQFDNAAWVKQNATITANAATSPDGTVDADKIIPTATNADHVARQTVTVANATHTYTIHAKADGYGFLAMQIASDTYYTKYFEGVFNLTTGAVEATGRSVTYTGSRSITPMGNGWYRCQITVNSIDANSTTIATALPMSTNSPTTTYAGDGTSGVLVYGAQLEAGSFATSYIPTVASQVTRTADSAGVVAPNFAPWYNQSEGTMVVSATAPNGPQTGAFARVFSVNDNSTVEYVDISRNSGRARGFVNDGGVGQVSIDAAAWGDGATARIAFAYKANDFAMSFNGAAVVTDTSGTVPTPFQATIGAAHSASSPFSGHIRSIRYYPTRLTDAQLQALTA